MSYIEGTIVAEYWQPDPGCWETGHERKGHPMVIFDKGVGQDSVLAGHPLSRWGLRVPTEEDGPCIYDYKTGDPIRHATTEERHRSIRSIGDGVIEVDGLRAYVPRCVDDEQFISKFCQTRDLTDVTTRLAGAAERMTREYGSDGCGEAIGFVKHVEDAGRKVVFEPIPTADDGHRLVFESAKKIANEQAAWSSGLILAALKEWGCTVGEVRLVSEPCGDGWAIRIERRPEP